MDLSNRYVCRDCWVMFPSQRALAKHKDEFKHKKKVGDKNIIADAKNKLDYVKLFGTQQQKVIAQWNYDIARAGKAGKKGLQFIDLILSRLFKEAEASRSSGNKKKLNLRKKSHGYVCCTCFLMVEGKEAFVDHIESEHCKAKSKSLRYAVGDAEQALMSIRG